MNVKKILPAPIEILRDMRGNDAISRPYLYNEVMDVIKKEKLPAVISNKGILISSPTLGAVHKLQELGIKFNMIV